MRSYNFPTNTEIGLLLSSGVWRSLAAIYGMQGVVSSVILCSHQTYCDVIVQVQGINIMKVLWR